MVHYVANGDDGDNEIQNANWTVNDTVESHMGAGNDWFTGWGASYEVWGEAGNDTIGSGFMGGTSWGGEGHDNLYGQATGHTNTLNGETGDDFLWAWGGANAGTTFAYGGEGNDRMRDSHGAGSDLFDGGNGFDWVEHDAGPIAVSLQAGTGGGGAAGNAYVSIEGLIGSPQGDALTGSDADIVLIGANGNDTLDGGLGQDLLVGFAALALVENYTNHRGAYGPFSTDADFSLIDLSITDDGAADSLLGGGGNDLLSGGNGADTMSGGGGFDTANYFSSATGVSVNLLTGIHDGEAALGDTLVSIENVSGSRHHDGLTGNAGKNVLRGFRGNDTLDGGAGADTMHGGADADEYRVDNSGDRTIELAGEGLDTVRSTVSRTLSANIENLALEGGANLTGNGNVLANTITGNGGDNLIQGYDSDDTLDGGAGDDELRGGTGIDRMLGGTGNDRYFVDEAADQTIEETGAGGGTDTVFSALDRALDANIENLRLQGGAANGTGNGLNNQIHGTVGANLLQGLDGNDTIFGKDGADTLAGGGGNDTLSGGSQADLFRFAAVGAGADRITDFNRNADRFDLGGGTFVSLNVVGTDTILTHTGGTIRVHGVNTLTLDQWNALTVPEGSAAGGLGLADFVMPAWLQTVAGTGGEWCLA